MAKNKPTQAKSVLGLEIGSANTRGFLFDVVENSYRMIASSSAPSTQMQPLFDIGEAVYEVVTRLQEVTGRVLLEKSGELILPAQPNGDGVDQFFVTTSCAPALKVVAAGLLSDVSLESAKKLAYAAYTNLVESIWINDRRPFNQKMDAVLAARPDLIILAGGTDDGASRSVTRTADLITGVLGFLPRGIRPQVLYCGNQALSSQLREAFGRYTSVRTAPNIRPSLEEEVLDPALGELNAMIMEKVLDQIGGLRRISPLCTIPPQLTNQAFHQIIKFLGRQYDPQKGVLGVDVGATYSMAAYANDRVSILNTFNLGLGSGVEELLLKSDIREISRWLAFSITDAQVSDYLWNRSLYPLSVASTIEESALERAAMRQVLRLMMAELEIREALPSSRFEPILLSGSLISRVVDPVQSLFVALDGMQPLGISPLILDKHGILPLLGAIANKNPLLAIQLLESTAFTNLATAISITSKARIGSTLLRARLDYPDGNYFEAEVKQGSILSLPLPSGMSGILRLQPTRRVEIEDFALNREPIKVVGGVCGVVLDARGRPIVLPEDPGKRTDLIKEWEFLLGAA
ncbi:MAG TPA: glutamate mutase L [Anaerolineaceae bacterium]|nr:glutamate mutase L [Anaerolineaceae bacterium]